jgi:hypothetical protein
MKEAKKSLRYIDITVNCNVDILEDSLLNMRNDIRDNGETVEKLDLKQIKKHHYSNVRNDNKKIEL